MSERCSTCDRVDCPWIKFEPMDWEEFDKYESEETSAAHDNCQFHAINWRARALKAEADLVACEKERDAYRSTLADMMERVSAEQREYGLGGCDEETEQWRHLLDRTRHVLKTGDQK